MRPRTRRRATLATPAARARSPTTSRSPMTTRTTRRPLDRRSAAAAPAASEKKKRKGASPFADADAYFAAHPDQLDEDGDVEAEGEAPQEEAGHVNAVQGDTHTVTAAGGSSWRSRGPGPRGAAAGSTRCTRCRAPNSGSAPRSASCRAAVTAAIPVVPRHLNTPCRRSRGRRRPRRRASRALIPAKT